MRCATSLFLLLALASVACTAHADAIDQFSITSAGLDIEFPLAPSVTAENSLLVGQYAAPTAPGTVNGGPSTIDARFIFPGACSACDIIFVSTTPLDRNAGTGGLYEIGLPDLYEYTAVDQNDVTLSFIPGSYPSDYIVHPYYDVVSAAITVTAENTAVTPEPPTLTLAALAVLVSLCFARFRPIDPG